MAKKPVGKVKDKSKSGAVTAVIRAFKTRKGTYGFEKRYIPTDEVPEFLKTKPQTPRAT
jgi:hypothetical protein